MNKIFAIASSAKIVAIQQKTNFDKDGSCKGLRSTDICEDLVMGSTEDTCSK